MPSLFVINWIVGAIGAVGITTVILLLIFAPAVASLLLKIVGAFLSTRLGLAVAVGAACLYGGLVYGDVSGRGEERAQCVAAQQRADQEAKQRDADQAKLSDDDATARVAELEHQHTLDQERIDSYDKMLATNPADHPCALGPDDLHGL